MEMIKPSIVLLVKVWFIIQLKDCDSSNLKISPQKWLAFLRFDLTGLGLHTTFEKLVQ